MAEQRAGLPAPGLCPGPRDIFEQMKANEAVHG